MAISENKLKHMLAVAETCEQIAANMHLPQDMRHACYLMGFLHDIGHSRKLDDYTEHGKAGADMIKDARPYLERIMAAIENHGKIYQEGRMTAFDKILNEADLTTAHDGTPITVKERLEKISKRCGKDSKHYRHAYVQAEALGLIGEIPFDRLDENDDKP